MDTSQVLDCRSNIIGCSSNLPVSLRTLIGLKFNRARVLWIGVDLEWVVWNIVEPVGVCGCHSLTFNLLVIFSLWGFFGFFGFYFPQFLPLSGVFFFFFFFLFFPIFCFCISYFSISFSHSSTRIYIYLYQSVPHADQKHHSITFIPHGCR